MNKDNAKHYLPLVQALADGKTIQLFHRSGVYNDVCSPDFSALPSDYRIKPELLEAWVNVYADGIRAFHNSKEEADLNAASDRIRCIKFVECLK